MAISRDKIKVGLKFRYISSFSSDDIWEILCVGEQKVFARRLSTGHECTWGIGAFRSSPNFVEYVELPKVGQTYSNGSNIAEVIFITDKSVAYRYVSPDAYSGGEVMMSVEFFQSHFKRCNP